MREEKKERKIGRENECTWRAGGTEVNKEGENQRVGRRGEGRRREERRS